jgi:purine-binding chemotaxis protein CheW
MTTDFSGPDRVFAFADSLGISDEEAPVIEEMTIPWVVFTLTGEWYALPVDAVQEIIRVGEITRVPDAPSVVRGVVNLRGRVLPVVDLRVRLGLPAAEPDKNTRIIVLPARGRWIGVLVDAVRRIERFRPSDVRPVPPDVLSARSDYFRGVVQKDDRLVVLLDAERVLLIHEGEMTTMNQIRMTEQ